MSEELRKKIVEILADYKFNSTQIYTTEQYADKIISLFEVLKWNIIKMRMMTLIVLLMI